MLLFISIRGNGICRKLCGNDGVIVLIVLRWVRVLVGSISCSVFRLCLNCVRVWVLMIGSVLVLGCCSN